MEKKGLMFALFTALVSGFSIFINKFGVTGVDPYVFTGAKNIIVAIFFLSLILIMRDYKELIGLSKNQWFKLVLIGLFGGSIPFLLFFKGLSMTSAAMGGLIQKTMFLFVTVGAIIFLKEKLEKKFVVGAILLLAGNFFLLKLNMVSFNAGDLLILIATLLWAVETLISKHVLGELSSKVVAFGRMGFGSFFIISFWASTGKIDLVFSLTAPQISWIILTSAFLAVYVASWYCSLSYLKASVATSILLIASPITTLLNIAFSGAGLTLGEAFGMIFILLGVMMAVGLQEIVEIFSHRIKLRA